MNNTVLVTSAVMMETIWENKQKDILDLIMPFVVYAVSQKTSVGDEIKIDRVAQYMEDNFGYKDIPDSVIKKILNRNLKKNFERKNKKYFLVKELDKEVYEFDKKREECNIRVNRIGSKLSIYLQSHCIRWSRKYTPEESILRLQDFFSRYGLFVGADKLEQQVKLSPRENEIDYYISRYIFENKKERTAEYRDILDLVKGYFLKTVIYLQPENGNLLSANYLNVNFYYDTPILLNLLGYQSIEEERAARALHEQLNKQKAKFYYFCHAETEMNNILTAYQHSLKSGEYTGRTLEGLDNKKYNASGVERLKNNWMSQLENSFQISERDIPEYIVKEDGTVDEKEILNEEEITSCILGQARSYKKGNIERDVDSIMAIHRLRKNYVCENIENARAVFVTNNYDLATAFNTYYKNKVNKKAFPLVITSTELAAMLWIKNGTTTDLPETQLLTNAYAALQPMPELLYEFSEILEQMQAEGKITSEDVAALRTNHYVHRELWKETFGDEELTNENTIIKIKQKYDENLIADYKRESEIEKQNERNKLYEMAEKRALESGKQSKKIWLKHLRNATKLIIIVIFVICLVATIKTWGEFKWNIFFGIAMMIAVFSLYDVWKAREKFVDMILLKIANRRETYIVEKKKNEYLKLFEDENNG